jgi:hypothetical protein
MPKTSCAGAPDAVAYPPPRRHSPATRASRALREGSTGRGTTRNAYAFLIPDPPSGFTGGRLTPRMGITHDPVAPRCTALSADRAGFHEQRWRCSCGTSAGGGANSDREASAAGECRRGGAGAGIGRASARCLATERGGRSPPRVKSGGRAAPRESQPAAELPGISTRGRAAEHPAGRQNCRASPPAQIARASPPAAEPPRTALEPRSAVERGPGRMVWFVPFLVCPPRACR